MEMKRTFFAVGVLSVFTGVAQAQSSVTLYGLIDEGLDYTNNVGGKKLYALSSGDVQGTRWGLKGTEDLGAGLKVVFKLESGFDVNSGKLGQEGAEFGRQAYIGMSSATFGTVTVGRQYDSVVDYLAPMTANGNWGGGMFTHPYDNDNTDNTFRLNNAVKYTSVDYSGFSFGGAYAFSNSTNFGMNRAISVGAQYSNGPVSLAAAYMNVDRPNAGTAGAVAIGPNGNPDGSWTAIHQRVFGAGIAYTTGSATVGFAYTHTNLSQPTATQYANFAASPTLGAATSLKFNNYEVNAKYQFTPAFYAAGMYTYTQATLDGATGGSAKPKYHQFGLMADYNLSKRTDVYAQAAYVKVASDSGVTGTGLEFAVNPDAAGPSSTSKQFMARVGIRHKF
ncbi:porin [Burkholderia sp. LMG 13014]